MRFKIFMAVTILLIFFWVKCRVDWLVEGWLKAIFNPEDGDNTLLRNVGFFQPIHTAI
jgi:hypothetical protein